MHRPGVRRLDSVSPPWTRPVEETECRVRRLVGDPVAYDVDDLLE